MHLQRNFVWTLNLSERELRLIIKVLDDKEEISDDEQGLADKLTKSLITNASRLERVSAGKRRQRSD
jgi:hypothetical protein